MGAGVLPIITEEQAAAILYAFLIDESGSKCLEALTQSLSQSGLQPKSKKAIRHIPAAQSEHVLRQILRTPIGSLIAAVSMYLSEYAANINRELAELKGKATSKEQIAQRKAKEQTAISIMNSAIQTSQSLSDIATSYILSSPPNPTTKSWDLQRQGSSSSIKPDDYNPNQPKPARACRLVLGRLPPHALVAEPGTSSISSELINVTLAKALYRISIAQATQRQTQMGVKPDFGSENGVVQGVQRILETWLTKSQTAATAGTAGTQQSTPDAGTISITGFSAKALGAIKRQLGRKTLQCLANAINKDTTAFAAAESIVQAEYPGTEIAAMGSELTPPSSPTSIYSSAESPARSDDSVGSPSSSDSEESAPPSSQPTFVPTIAEAVRTAIGEATEKDVVDRLRRVLTSPVITRDRKQMQALKVSMDRFVTALDEATEKINDLEPEESRYGEVLSADTHKQINTLISLNTTLQRNESLLPVPKTSEQLPAGSTRSTVPQRPKRPSETEGDVSVEGAKRRKQGESEFTGKKSPDSEAEILTSIINAINTKFEENVNVPDGSRMDSSEDESDLDSSFADPIPGNTKREINTALKPTSAFIGGAGELGPGPATIDKADVIHVWTTAVTRALQNYLVLELARIDNNLQGISASMKPSRLLLPGGGKPAAYLRKNPGRNLRVTAVELMASCDKDDKTANLVRLKMVMGEIPEATARAVLEKISNYQTIPSEAWLFLSNPRADKEGITLDAFAPFDEETSTPAAIWREILEVCKDVDNESVRQLQTTLLGNMKWVYHAVLYRIRNQQDDEGSENSTSQAVIDRITVQSPSPGKAIASGHPKPQKTMYLVNWKGDDKPTWEHKTTLEGTDALQAWTANTPEAKEDAVREWNKTVQQTSTESVKPKAKKAKKKASSNTSTPPATAALPSFTSPKDQRGSPEFRRLINSWLDLGCSPVSATRKTADSAEFSKERREIESAISQVDKCSLALSNNTVAQVCYAKWWEILWIKCLGDHTRGPRGIDVIFGVSGRVTKEIREPDGSFSIKTFLQTIQKSCYPTIDGFFTMLGATAYPVTCALSKVNRGASSAGIPPSTSKTAIAMTGSTKPGKGIESQSVLHIVPMLAPSGSASYDDTGKLTHQGVTAWCSTTVDVLSDLNKSFSDLVQPLSTYINSIKQLLNRPLEEGSFTVECLANYAAGYMAGGTKPSGAPRSTLRPQASELLLSFRQAITSTLENTEAAGLTSKLALIKKLKMLLDEAGFNATKARLKEKLAVMCKDKISVQNVFQHGLADAASNLQTIAVWAEEPKWESDDDSFPSEQLRHMLVINELMGEIGPDMQCIYPLAREATNYLIQALEEQEGQDDQRRRVQAMFVADATRPEITTSHFETATLVDDIAKWCLNALYNDKYSKNGFDVWGIETQDSTGNQPTDVKPISARAAIEKAAKDAVVAVAAASKTAASTASTVVSDVAAASKTAAKTASTVVSDAAAAAEQTVASAQTAARQEIQASTSTPKDSKGGSRNSTLRRRKPRRQNTTQRNMPY